MSQLYELTPPNIPNNGFLYQFYFELINGCIWMYIIVRKSNEETLKSELRFYLDHQIFIDSDNKLIWNGKDSSGDYSSMVNEKYYPQPVRDHCQKILNLKAFW